MSPGAFLQRSSRSSRRKPRCWSRNPSPAGTQGRNTQKRPRDAGEAWTAEKLDAGTLDEVLTVHQYGVAMTILNASMRIMRISHIDMQRVLYSLTRDFDAMCRTATRTPLEQMSNYAPMTDILAASHVKAHVRLFMG